MIEINDLSYSIKSKQILNDLSLDIKRHQYYALAGENGAGKSTLIKILLDLIRNIQSGSVMIDGEDNKNKSVRQKLSYLPEKFDIKNDVTGWQYLRFVNGIYQQRVDKEKINELCNQLSFDIDRLGDKTNKYSKGMKQKLGLVSCFMLDNPLIVLDEPLTGLDPKARYHFKQLLKEERDNDRTIFYSTHLLADAEEISDQFGILHQGRIVFNGSPADCLSRFKADTLERAYMKCIAQQ